MNTRVKSEIIALARANPTEEICGFIYHELGHPKVYPCRNIAENVIEEFEISSDDYLEALKRGEILGVYHSQPETFGFSIADLDNADEVNLPYYLYVVSDGSWHEYIPSGFKPGIEGTSFVWGFNDCYGNLRNVYRQKCNIHIRDYDRDESFENDGNQLIIENFAKEGFIEIEGIKNVKNYDAFCFKTGSIMHQHLGVFMGNSRFCHHKLNALSKIDLLDGHWIGRINKIFRHKSLMV